MESGGEASQGRNDDASMLPRNTPDRKERLFHVGPPIGRHTCVWPSSSYYYLKLTNLKKIIQFPPSYSYIYPPNCHIFFLTFFEESSSCLLNIKNREKKPSIKHVVFFFDH